MQRWRIRFQSLERLRRLSSMHVLDIIFQAFYHLCPSTYNCAASYKGIIDLHITYIMQWNEQMNQTLVREIFPQYLIVSHIFVFSLSFYENIRVTQQHFNFVGNAARCGNQYKISTLHTNVYKLFWVKHDTLFYVNMNVALCSKNEFKQF